MLDRMTKYLNDLLSEMFCFLSKSSLSPHTRDVCSPLPFKTINGAQPLGLFLHTLGRSHSLGGLLYICCYFLQLLYC